MSKKPSLAAQTETAMVPADLADRIDTMTAVVPDAVDTSSGSNFVCFAHPMSPKWADYCSSIPGLKESEVVLVPRKPAFPVRLAPFRFFFVTGAQYWAKCNNDDGEVMVASMTDPGRDAGLQETFDAVLFVFTPDGQVAPARCSFRGAKCQAPKSALTALQRAATQEWGGLSAAHQLTLALPRPWMRFVTTVSTQARTSKSTGNKYTVANGAVAPTSLADKQALEAFFKRENASAEFNAVFETYENRLAQVKEAAGK